MLDARGLFPVQIAAAKAAAAAARFGTARQAAGTSPTFYSQLADLLHSGVPLLRSLEHPRTAEHRTRRWRACCAKCAPQVADGTGLAEAMAQHPNAFNELAVSMVRAGQEGGFLEDVLKRIADFTEHQEDLKAKVIGALAYPIFLAVVGFVVLNVLVIFFVPQFEPIFEKLEEKGELPALTIVLIGVSHFMQRTGGWSSPIGASWPVIGFRALGRDAERAGCIVDALRLRHAAARARSSSAWPCRASPASSARCCTTASRSCRRCASPRTRPATGCWPQAIEKSAENITAGDSLADAAGRLQATSRATWSR